ncbi:hypothetical protein ACFYWS_39535 [Streptomyces sp. NPDC002795]|uniref:hypothetical protein n=1 Tax=Streptomyces sp. NPDC002795 TaxID=3364665 RepID=UPI0036D0329A
MSAPLVVNTVEGTVWTRRPQLRDGADLYAPQKCPTCPEFLMATYAELTEHGIAGEAFALPMPVGVERAADRLTALLAPTQALREDETGGASC